MPREGLIPSIRRSIRNGIGAAGDATGNFINSNGKVLQDAAYATGRQMNNLSGGNSVKSTSTTATRPNKNSQTVGQAVGKQVKSYAAYAGSQVEAVGRHVDASGRALGGRVGDFGNSVKDATGARGKRMSTPQNPLGLSGH